MRAFLIAAGIAVASIAMSYAQIGGGSGIYNRFGSGSGPAPPTCNGTIDLSKGCALPMFGGL